MLPPLTQATASPSSSVLTRGHPSDDVEEPAGYQRGAILTEGSIAYVRVQQHSSPDVQKYVAVRVDELAAFIAQSDHKHTIEAFNLDLPPEETSRLAAQFAAIRKRPLIGVIIGTVTGDVWITGPLAGQPGPRYNLAGRKQCGFRTAGGDRCVMAARPGQATCPMHAPSDDPEPQPTTLWDIWA